MADICFVGEGEASASAKPRQRTSGNREMKFLQPNPVSDVTASPPAPQNERKRRRIVLLPRECENAAESSLQNDAGVEDDEASPEWPKYGFTSVCGRRRDMEDAVSVHPLFATLKNQDDYPLHYFAVFDGHGCFHVAKTCEDRMHEIMKEEIEKEEESVDWKKTMQQSFERMDEEVKEYGTEKEEDGDSTLCRCELQTPHKYDTVGSTALVAIVTLEKIVISNCGDSRAVLGRKNDVVPLSSDHKPDRSDELDRIESAGGRVIYWDGPRVLGVLAMSRAIGDSYLKPYVISEPEATVTDRTAEDEFLILASDGLWDVVSNDTACGVVRMSMRAKKKPSSPGSSPATMASGSDKACSDAANLLTKLALARHSSDNISVVVVDLRSRENQQQKQEV